MKVANDMAIYVISYYIKKELHVMFSQKLDTFWISRKVPVCHHTIVVTIETIQVNPRKIKLSSIRFLLSKMEKLAK